MDKSKVKNYFIKKMRFKNSPRTRHNNYVPEVNGKVAMPRLFTISRGGGAISRGNLKGIAEGLGLNESLFKESVQCRIGRVCAIITMCANILDHCVRNLQMDPIAHKEGAKAMSAGIQFLLDDAFDHSPEPPTALERKAIERISPKVGAALGYPDLKNIAQMVLNAIGRFK
ncbi:hypothetical protein [Neptuniibacter sp.]|uniref:hypothetical protein n=1 Tax=Neptuniibacter sp. TaxID=1962643 RepID=UPI002639E73B|nr:hypothetical protein [Neptuniibacter sp.]MCP4597278.1 hypothetical protein [Neptuniibacter sp.]